MKSLEEIRAIREQYGLSQRSFAKLLNWGDKTICRYENGSIQDKAHNSLLLFLREPQNMRAYVMENEIGLDEKQTAKLLETIEKLEDSNGFRTIINIQEGNLSEEERTFLERIWKLLLLVCRLLSV